jgi:nucleoside-diphosphate-sugar epimerase
MQVFLTGGTGYVGAAVLDALIRAGHHVTTLVRDPEKAARLEARGATPVLGEMAKPGRFLPRILEADAIVHAAFQATPRGPDVDKQFLDTVLPALAASPRRRVFVYTSAVWVLGTQPSGADESAPLMPIPLVAWRPAHEAQVLDARSDLLRAAVVRPGIVYGGSRGIISDMLKDALNGLVRVIGDGTNRWSCVYDRDLGDLYARIVAAGDASGIFHAAGDEGERVLDIAQAIASHASPEADIRYMPLAEAQTKMGGYADALALDQLVRCPRARGLGWAPAMHGITGNATRLFEEYRRAASRE